MIRGTRTAIPASTRIDRVHLCDFCGEDVEKGNGFFAENEATVEMFFGDHYPEQDCRDRVSIDVCHVCFRAKVMPAIEALGVKFRTRDADDYDHVDEMTPEPKP
jgi:hypothetical protein